MKKIEDAADVRVRHLPREVDLLLEALDRAWVGGHFRVDGLERNASTELLVLGFVYARPFRPVRSGG